VNVPLKEADKNKVVLVTTTSSPSLDDIRAQLAIKTCLAAREHGYRIIVVEGSPCLEFKMALWRTGATVTDQTERGMGVSRRQTLKAGIATEAEVIAWIEPEKHTLIPLLEPCITPILTKQADVVIPHRQNLDGYPHYQQLSERRGNRELGNITGRPDLDPFFGPRIMSRKAASIMAGYTGQGGKNVYGDKWEILFVPIVWFIKNDMRIESVTVDYHHPPEQLAEDDASMRTKRDEQRTCIVKAMDREAKRLRIKRLFKHV
jgi:hypothetical protein